MSFTTDLVMDRCPRGRMRFWSYPDWCNCKSPVAQALRNIDSSTCNQQHDCPLFKILPGEIRTLIYEYCLQEEESEWFGFASYHRRPDYPKNRYIGTALLQTCRLIYLETQPMVLRNISVLRFWLGDKRRGPSKLYPRSPSQPGRYCLDYRLYKEYGWADLRERFFPGISGKFQHDLLGRFTNGASNLLDLLFGEPGNYSTCDIPVPTPQRVQVFAQLFAIEQQESQLTQLIEMVSQDITVTHLTLTIRYTDWWWWEQSLPLTFSNRTTGMLRLPNTVQEFNLELETRNGKKAELDALVPQIEAWGVGNSLTWEKEVYAPVPKFLYSGKTEFSWITSSRQGMTKPPRNTIPTILHHYPAANDTPDLPQDKMMLWVVRLKWLQQRAHAA